MLCQLRLPSVDATSSRLRITKLAMATPQSRSRSAYPSILFGCCIMLEHFRTVDYSLRTSTLRYLANYIRIRILAGHFQRRLSTSSDLRSGRLRYQTTPARPGLSMANMFLPTFTARIAASKRSTNIEPHCKETPAKCSVIVTGTVRVCAAEWKTGWDLLHPLSTTSQLAGRTLIDMYGIPFA